MLGSALTLRCLAKGSTKEVRSLRYSWIFVSKDSGERVTAGSASTLPIPAVGWQSAGEYTCIVTSENVPGQLLTGKAVLTVVTTQAEADALNREEKEREKGLEAARKQLREAERPAAVPEQASGKARKKKRRKRRRKKEPTATAGTANAAVGEWDGEEASLRIVSHPGALTVERLEPAQLHVVALGDPTGGGLLYTWLRGDGGEVVRGPASAEEGGATLEIRHAGLADSGW